MTHTHTHTLRHSTQNTIINHFSIQFDTQVRARVRVGFDVGIQRCGFSAKTEEKNSLGYKRGTRERFEQKLLSLTRPQSLLTTMTSFYDPVVRVIIVFYSLPHFTMFVILFLISLPLSLYIRISVAVYVILSNFTQSRPKTDSLSEKKENCDFKPIEFVYVFILCHMINAKQISRSV